MILGLAVFHPSLKGDNSSFETNNKTRISTCVFASKVFQETTPNKDIPDDFSEAETNAQNNSSASHCNLSSLYLYPDNIKHDSHLTALTIFKPSLSSAPSQLFVNRITDPPQLG